MIWSLAREQLRSQRRYAITAGVLIAAAIAIAVYGALMSATLVRTSEQIDAFTGPPRTDVAMIMVPEEQSLDEVTAGIDKANSLGHSVFGWALTGAYLPGSAESADPREVEAYYGDIDWAARGTAGMAPQRGEIAVSEAWAAEHNVSIGDTISLEALEYEALEYVGADFDPMSHPLDAHLVVSGFTYSSVDQGGINLTVPEAYVSWHDAYDIRLDAFAAQASANGDVEAQEPWLSVNVSGNGDFAWNASMSTWPDDQGNVLVTHPSSSMFYAIAILGVTGLVLGIFAAAFALGRAQAQARSRWVATVRALGANKEQILWSAAVEAVAIGVAAALVGLAMGAGAVAAHLGLVAAKVPGAMLTPATSFSVPVVAGGLMFGVILSLTVGAVPAFWSARVEPAAALKPVADLADVHTSRKVRVRPLAIAWSAALTVAVYGAFVGFDGTLALLVVVAGLVLVVGGVMLAHEALRMSLPWHARRLSQSRRKPVMIAGDAILARPRQFTIPAFITALATSVLLAVVMPLVAQDNFDLAQFPFNESPIPNEFRYAHVDPVIFLSVFALVTFVCVAIAVATAALTSREAAAREALGVSPTESRLAASVQYLVAQAHGLVLGLFGGLLLGAFTIKGSFDWAYDVAHTWIGPVLILLAVVLACGAACAVIGAAVVAAFKPATAPLATLEAAA